MNTPVKDEHFRAAEKIPANPRPDFVAELRVLTENEAEKLKVKKG